MCYTATASALFALGLFAVAAYEHRAWGNKQYTMAIAYFGLMELLQAVQHFWLAVPEDDYAMCKNPTNQMLTFLGLLHICFQPLFTNMALQAFFRNFDIRDRIESELIQKLCIMAGFWLLSSYFYVIIYPDNPKLAPQANEECPNYEWMRSGYDPYHNYTTPNLPGHSCTFLAPSENGHLAWSVPSYQGTYFMPSTSLHFFFMFVPYICMTRRPILQVLAVLMFLTGPFANSGSDTAINEQAAVWCYISVFQVAFLVIIFRWKGVHGEPIPSQIEVPGKLGEEPLIYVRMSNLTQNFSFTSDSSDSIEVASKRSLLAVNLGVGVDAKGE